MLNSIPNILPYHRFAVVIGSKSVTNNITRNFFRRKFYNLMAGYITQDMGQQKKGQYRDMVFVVKKTTALDKKET
ncbi:MAG: hypothetical protein H6767_07015 [Candidatus Peribacteria bacterium]|nr:MAG: hypothetical protein H6767_07015 [Candidatus Peribacteria bacterium]